MIIGFMEKYCTKSTHDDAQPVVVYCPAKVKFNLQHRMRHKKSGPSQYMLGMELCA